MKRILVLLLAMVLITALTIGSTVAYMTYASEAPPKVVVTIDNAQELNEEVVLFTGDTYWEPGHMQIRHIQMNGTDFTYKFRFTTETANQKLAEAIEVWYNASGKLTDDMDRQTLLDNMYYAGTLAEVIAANGGVFLSSENPVAQSASIAVALRMSESAGNIFMGLSIEELFMVVETSPVVTQTE